MRQVAAILIAPLTPALAVILFAVVASMSWPFNETDYKIFIGVASAVSYFSSFSVGLPVLYFLRKYGKLKLHHIALAGGVSGIAVFSLLQVFIALSFGSMAAFGILTVVWGFACGFCVAVSYALISGITSASNSFRP
ncbi:hypothetical protein [Marinobacter sp.]|uniref:hypothetical protein n=1 Tax=Marinobacter sp. TaxID=50741 RepID=UPI003B516D0B